MIEMLRIRQRQQKREDMAKFEIRDRFYLDNEPFQIISGAIHYFRVLPEYWEDRLLKLKALGCNTVETYIPWNMHEPEKGNFEFYGEKVHGMLDIAAFVTLAQKLGLWVILRPSPYICAEWDFGGLPAWLLAEERMTLRTCDEKYLRHVKEYYDALLPVLVPLQIDQGGPVLMMQVENEYGSFGNDKKYLESIRDMMIAGGITVPLFASDGPQDNMLSNTKIDGVFPTANFGSAAKESFEILRNYNDGGPCMCTEFWIGWFDHWFDEGHHVGAADAAAGDLADMLKEGNVNIYMFEGGTNFGFMNGANDTTQLGADVTSYDYGALLTEDGQITEKYRKFAEVIHAHLQRTGAETAHLDDGQRDGAENSEASSCSGSGFDCGKRKGYGTVSVDKKVGLFQALGDISEPIGAVTPQSMERLGQNYGYILYSTDLRTEKELRSIRMYQANDRAIVFADGKRVLTAMDRELLERHEICSAEDTQHADRNVVRKDIQQTGDSPIQLDILMENMGRVNYGPMLNWQRKGIDGCVMINDVFSQHYWKQYCLPLDNLDKLDYSRGYEPGMPAFYHFEFEVDEAADTFLDLDGWGKGVAFINGFNLGRFWEVGPQRRLYLPGALLKEGTNDIIVFESEGKAAEYIELCDAPDLGVELKG